MTLNQVSGGPSTIAGYASAIARTLEYKGVDSRRVFRAAGIENVPTNDPLDRIAVADFTRLFRIASEITHDPYFGLAVGRFIHVSNAHAVGYALMASATLMDFAERLERYFRLLSGRARMDLEAGRREVTLKFSNTEESCDESEDALLSFLIRFMRLLHRAELDPLRVEMMHACPREGAAPYRSLFRAPVTFGNAGCAMVFDRADFEQPLHGACAELARVNDNLAASYLSKLDRADIVAAVKAKIIDLLPSGRTSLGDVAASLGQSVPALKSKLAQRGTSFQAQLDSTREALARSYLAQSNLSVTEITYLLGFADVSNFTRAFKRWTGLSPSAHRRGIELRR